MSIHNNKVSIKYHPNTIDHLGSKLYSQTAPILAEYISNAWDAEANKVTIIIDNKEKTIFIKDDGAGMTFDELNNRFLVIGLDRRKLKNIDLLGRRPIGRKGIGKLAGFGIGNILTVETYTKEEKSGHKFSINYEKDIKKHNTKEIEECNFEVEKINKKSLGIISGTTIILSELKRKTDLIIKDLAPQISRYFDIFHKMEVIIHDKNTKESITIKNSMYLDKKLSEFEWKIPEDLPNDFIYKKEIEKYGINGYIATSSKALSNKDLHRPGISLLSRGRTVEQSSFFNLRDTDYVYKYMYGKLDLGNFEDSKDVDIISTNRSTLDWNKEELNELESILYPIIRFIANDWKSKRNNKKCEEFQNKKGYDIFTKISEDKDLNISQKKYLESYIKELMDKDIDTDILIDLCEQAIDNMKFDEYYELIDIVQKSLKEEKSETEKIISVAKTWFNIEEKQFHKITKNRLNAIDILEQHVTQNSLEVTVIEPFLLENSWLINPKIGKLEKEIKYSDLVKNQKDWGDDLKNNRIDLLSLKDGNSIYIFELKRPSVQIKVEQVNQIERYYSFIENHLKKTDTESSYIIYAYLIGEKEASQDAMDQIKHSTRNIYYKTYSTLIQEAKNFYKDYLLKIRNNT